MADALVTLVLLILLQAVLGLDNLLYISIESKRATPADRPLVRRLGIGIAVALRIVLLFVLMHVIATFAEPFLNFRWTGVLEGAINLHSVIVLCGGAFIVYTAMREVLHMAGPGDLPGHDTSPKSTPALIAAIVTMNLVFSFDSILSAMALSDSFWIMATAIVIGGGLMIVLADRVAAFLEKNRMMEILGLFILFVVGVMLLTEGGHLAHLRLFGNEITPMSKTTFYFVIGVLVLTDVAQTRYQKRLLAQRSHRARAQQAG